MHRRKKKREKRKYYYIYICYTHNTECMTHVAVLNLNGLQSSCPELS